MKFVIQRTSKASVMIEQKVYSSIVKGLVVLIGIEKGDTTDLLDYYVKKIVNMRIFNDHNQKMNQSLLDIKGEILLVSQFTLLANTKKGNRPSYIRAAKPDVAIPLYEKFITKLEKETSIKIQTGQFGADMKVELLNDGPVTIIIDSKNRE